MMIHNILKRKTPYIFFGKKGLLNNRVVMVSSLILYICLCILNTGCIPNQMVNEPVPTRSILENNLPIDLRWSAPANPDGDGTPMTCFEDHGAIVGTMTEEDVQLKGTIFFNNEGKVLWHQPQGLPSAVALDDKQVYVFNSRGIYSRPGILVYDTHTGEEVWQTGEELDFRQGIDYLEVQGSELTYFTARQVNTYATDDGEMIAGESIPTGNIVMRQSGIDLYDGNGFYLYATVSGEPEAYLWTADYNINGLPHVYEENIIVKRRRSVVCGVELASGQTNWCSDKHLYNSSNIAIHEDLGYAVNSDHQLIAFRLSDGTDVGFLQFQPLSIRPRGASPFLAACAGHLLVYLPSPDEIFWFDFQ